MQLWSKNGGMWFLELNDNIVSNLKFVLNIFLTIVNLLIFLRKFKYFFYCDSFIPCSEPQFNVSFILFVIE